MDATIKEIIEYNTWANQLYRNYFAKIDFTKLGFETPYGSMKEILVHLITTIDLFLDRIDGKHVDSLKPAKDFLTWKDLSTTWELADKHFIISASSQKDLDREVNYMSLEKKSLQLSVRKIYIHISEHQIYHRGQIATLMRLNHFPPLPSTDSCDYFFSK